MFCFSCGKEIGEKSKFCRFCGANQKDGIEKESSNKEEYIWTCDYCDKEFDTEKECDQHEKKCELNPKNKKNTCPECGSEITSEAIFCGNCGYKL